MKKMIFGLLATALLMSNSYGQSNNPYNQFGEDLVNAANVILKDYQNGKIKDIDQATLDYYYKTVLSSYPKVKMAEFTKIFDVLKTATNKSIIENSGYSDEGKAFLNKTLTNSSITELVENVKKSKISDTEKQNILHLLAVNYNIIKPATADKGVNKTSGKGPNADFSISESIAPEFTATEGAPVALWGALGFIIGNNICGLPCGALGGVIGMVFGAATGSNTSIHVTGGQHTGWAPHP